MPLDPIKLLQQYADAGCNILTPYISLDGLTERHKATIETLKLSAFPEDGDVYKDKNGPNFILTKHALDKLGLLANIFWPPKIGLYRLDDKSNPDYVAYQAYGLIKKADDVIVPCTAGYDIDLITEKENLEHQYRAKGKKDNKKGKKLEDYVQWCTDRDIRNIRKFKCQRCESGAKNRVIRALLALKANYSKAQLSKPFVVIRINYVPDYENPKVQEYLLKRNLDAQFSIFGKAPSPTPSSPPQLEHNPLDTEEPKIGEPIEPAPRNGIDDTEPLDDQSDDFALWDRPSQEKHIIALARKKDYDLAGMIKKWRKVESLSAITDIDLIRILDHITPMEDKEPDDIPF